MDDSNTPRLVKSTTTSLDIIETIRNRDGATLTEIAEELDIGYSTAYNHLATLEEQEWLIKWDGEYDIGLKLLHYGEYARRRTSLYSIARRYMYELSEKTNLEIEFLVEEYGRLISIVDIVGDASGFGQPEDGKWLQVGEYYYMHNTASGKAILAEWPQERVERAIDKWGLPAQTSYSVTDRGELFDQLETVREQGYAKTAQEVVEGFANVGTAVLYPDGRVLGAISIGWPTYLYNDDIDPEVVDHLLTTTKNIEAEIEDVLSE